MIEVGKSAWALLLGMFLLMVGNGVHGTLLGVRGAIEGFSAAQMSWIMSGYFIGFLGGSRLAPELIRRVGHVRVFAALASLISAALLMFAAIPNEFAWFAFRVLVGFGFSGVYVVAESWLNDSATNETRGQALSAYLIVQMMGIVFAQWMLTWADPAGFLLFIMISVAVSISFAPILLSVSPAPLFSTTKPMSIAAVYRVSPLGVVGTFFLGGIFAALFGMAAVYGTESGLSVGEISTFVATIYLGGMLCQYPIGWMSDRMDRRVLILSAAIGGVIAGSIGFVFDGHFEALLVAGFLIGGMSNPLYALLIAYMNDYLETDDMAAASGGLIFVNGTGAIIGPILTGWAMESMGARGFWMYLLAVMALMAAYVAFRMTQRASIYAEEDDYDAVAYAPIFANATPVVGEFAQEYYAENVESEDEPGDAAETSLERT